MLCYKGIADTVLWFEKAKPEPTPKDLTTQIGVHLEEVREMLIEIVANEQSVDRALKEAAHYLDMAADALKTTNKGVYFTDRTQVLDSLCDQIVTTVGIANMAKMKIENGLNEVNRSNFSKFDDNNNPILDNNRKIIKGPGYSKPDLTSFV